MRHIWSLILALVLTPLSYVAAGVCAVRLTDAHGLGASTGIGLAAGLLAGGLYAVLVMVRISPVGPVTAGLAYLGVTLWALLNRSGFEHVLPATVFGEAGALYRPVGMGTALLAVPLLLTIFSSSRWRGVIDPNNPYNAAPNYPTTVPSAAPSYANTATSAAPVYSPSSSLPSAPSTYEPPIYTPPTKE